MPAAWSKVPSYWVAQVFGAFVGAALVYLNDHDAISAVDAANKVTRCRRRSGGAYVYDYAVRDVLIARGAEPDPEIEEAAETAIDEPGGAAQT